MPPLASHERNGRAPTSGQVSFWHQAIGAPGASHAGLQGEAEADVAIIGAGFTGLWSAHYLQRAAPHLRITMLEARHAGFGASGRNGGWLTGGFAWSQQRYAHASGREATLAMVSAMHATVDEVIAEAEALGISADIQRTDELSVARSPAQLQRLRDEFAHRAAWGEAERLELIGPEALGQRIAIPGALGALVTRGVARLQPAKLVQGLARAVTAAGVRLHENSPVTAITGRGPDGWARLRTPEGLLRARHVLRCTEGFTATLPGHRRDWLPLNSAQITTAPLPPALWAQIGWQGRELLGTADHVYAYCQRSADDRLVVGARGTPYRFGSRIDHDGAPDAATVAGLHALRDSLFPMLQGQPVAHAWCGVLGVPRDWCATVGLDRQSGIGWAGGYVGVGVSTSNLAARALCELVLGDRGDTAPGPLAHLAFVGRRVRRWEPEPLRWLGVRGMYALLALADQREARTGGSRSSRLARLAYALGGRA